MKSFIICVVMIFSYHTANCDDIPEKFQKLLDRGKLTFEQPKGMKLTKVKSDSLMKYDIAYKDAENDFEIRINILPLDSSDKYKENLDILNSAKEGTYQAIDVRPELFNSGKAGAAEFEFDKKYGDGYKYGSVLFIYKEKCAVVYIFYLGAKKEILTPLVIDNFFLVKFKK